MSRLVQRKLAAGVANGTAVVKHLATGDELGWDVRAFQKFKNAYRVGKDKQEASAPVGDINWGLVSEQATSRQAFDAGQASAPFDYSTLLKAETYPKTDFRYWFYYMLQQVSDPGQKLGFVQEAFKPEPGRVVKDLDDPAKKSILSRMFAIGFVSFENLGPEMQKNLIKSGAELSPKTALQGTSFALGFRGDSRDTDILKGHGGFATKADSPDQGFRKSMGLDQDWNPFKDQASLPGQNATGNAAFFRRDDKDNDLTTAVSVAKNFHVATKFPMLEENYVPIEEVDVNGAKKKKTTIFVYIMIVETGLDTAGAQGTSGEFPELATISIPWHNHAAVMKIERIHHGNTANDGHTFSVVDTKLGRAAQEKHKGTPVWNAVLAEVTKYASIKDYNYDPAKM